MYGDWVEPSACKALGVLLVLGPESRGSPILRSGRCPNLLFRHQKDFAGCFVIHSCITSPKGGFIQKQQNVFAFW